MLTILPRLCAFMAGNTARHARNRPRRLTAMTRSHSSTGISSQERRGSTLISEALLMSTSIEPKRSSAARAIALVESIARDIDAEPERRKALGSKRLGHSLGGRLIDVGRHHACADASEFPGVDLADALAAT